MHKAWALELRPGFDFYRHHHLPTMWPKASFWFSVHFLTCKMWTVPILGKVTRKNEKFSLFCSKSSVCSAPKFSLFCYKLAPKLVSQTRTSSFVTSLWGNNAIIIQKLYWFIHNFPECQCFALPANNIWIWINSHDWVQQTKG